MPTFGNLQGGVIAIQSFLSSGSKQAGNRINHPCIWTVPRGVPWPSMSRPRLVLLDGYSLLFRAFYGSRMLSTSDGRPTNALFGFLNMLFSLFSDPATRPDQILVALDAPGKTFRHADFPEYKGTRRETPPELISQLILSRELLADLNIPVCEITGYEADDILGTLSKRAEEAGWEAVLFTGDHDSLQLVSQHTSVLMPQNGPVPPKLYGPAEVFGRYGFAPDQIRDYKAMAGDSSDNIPGVPGIGDKSATLLIQQFGNVETIAARIEEVEPKFRKKIEPAIDVMLLSKKLVTIEREVPIDFSLARYEVSEKGLEMAKQALLNIEFKSMVRRLENSFKRYLVGGIEEPELPESLRDRPVPAEVHQEALSFEVLEEVSGMVLKTWIGSQPFAILPQEGKAQTDLFDEEEPPLWWIAKENEVRPVKLESALSLLQSKASQAVGFDLKQLYHHFDKLGETPRNDVMVSAYVLQSGRSSYELSSLFSAWLEGVTVPSGAGAAAGLLLLDRELTDRAEKEGQTSVVKDIELPLIPLLAEMEGNGIQVSAEMLKEFSASLEVEIAALQKKVWDLAGEEFNISSPKQIGTILFEKMALPGGRKTKTGWATGAEILEEMAPTVPLAGEILSYRELTKLKSTYADALPRMIGRDGRIHTSFNQTVAATGRLSSNEPNLQNIPIRTELGRQIRRAFGAPEGRELLSLDYSQIELRILAAMCRDENLVEAFIKRVDVHTVTAALMFGLKEEDVSKEQRRLAKMLNYAVLYGVSGFGLANQLGAGFSQGEAGALIKQYNERFPAVKAFTDGIIEEARAKGFTVTLKGRRRHFPDIHAANRTMRQYAERQAMNAPIQGTAADMIKLAMIQVRPLLESKGWNMLLQVHDELVFEIPTGDRSLVEPIREVMETALTLGDVPVEVDAKVGPNWLEMSALPRG